MPEQVAVISANDKTGVPELATGLAELENWRIFSYGNTEVTIKGAGVQVHPIEELVGGTTLGSHPANREFKAQALAYLMFQPKYNLGMDGLTPVDLAYVNPKKVAYSPKHGEFVDPDFGGTTMIMAAALGQRILGTRPEDVSGILKRLEAGTLDENYIRLLSSNALRNLGISFRDIANDEFTHYQNAK